MAKKKSKQPVEEKNEHRDEQLLEVEPLDGLDIANFALKMAVEARIYGLSAFLFPILQRIEDGEKITKEDILDTLSSVKIGDKTALEKLEYLRKQQ